MAFHCFRSWFSFLNHFWRILWKLLRTSLHVSSAYHPQSDKQIEVINRSLGDMWRCLVGDNIKSWDTILCQAEFTHNHEVNRSNQFSPFWVVYGLIPRGSLAIGIAPDITRDHCQAIEFVGNLSHIHAQVHENLQSMSAKYKEVADQHRRDVQFRVGEFVWAVLTKDCFPLHEWSFPLMFVVLMCSTSNISFPALQMMKPKIQGQIFFYLEWPDAGRLSFHIGFGFFFFFLIIFFLLLVNYGCVTYPFLRRNKSSFPIRIRNRLVIVESFVVVRHLLLIQSNRALKPLFPYFG